ncbi:MAG: chemotaxis protein CheW [Lachnospiraceae bacterium]|nr:chemotaxis protein CheW [Lachnospiraceae bacterium]
MEEMKPVVFKLGNELYGVDINLVQGIEREQQVVRVPNTVSYIKGIINLRGEIIPVYDLKEKFQMKHDSEEESQYVIVKVKNSKLALEVDGVKEIHDISSEDLFRVPPIICNSELSYFNKVIKSDNSLIILIQVDNLLSDEEIARIDEIVNQ